MGFIQFLNEASPWFSLVSFIISSCVGSIEIYKYIKTKTKIVVKQIILYNGDKIGKVHNFPNEDSKVQILSVLLSIDNLSSEKVTI